MHSTWYSAGDFSTEINDLPGAGTWPITMGTYIAVPRVAAAGDRAERTLRFLTWAYLHGDALARQAKFVPLPERVQASAYREISRVMSASGEIAGRQDDGQPGRLTRLGAQGQMAISVCARRAPPTVSWRFLIGAIASS